MDQYLGLILSAELIKAFGKNLNDIMGLLIKGHLHDSRQSVTPGNHPLAHGAVASQTDHPGLIDVAHLQFPDDLFHPQINIFGQTILNHDPKDNPISSLSQLSRDP